MPSLTPSPDPYQGKCDPLPVSATLVFPEEFKEYSFRFDEPVHSTHIYFDAGFEKEFRIGESSEKLFVKGFRCMFENVTVGLQPAHLSANTVLYIPKVESVSVQVKPPGANVEANVTYSLSVTTYSGEDIASAVGQGNGSHEESIGGCCLSNLGSMLTFGVSTDTQDALYVKSALSDAEATAFLIFPVPVNTPYDNDECFVVNR